MLSCAALSMLRRPHVIGNYSVIGILDAFIVWFMAALC